MVIQQLQPDPSAWSQILGSLGGGLGQSFGTGVQQGTESSVLNQIMQQHDVNKDPMGFINALISAPGVSQQTKQNYISASTVASNLNKAPLALNKEIRLETDAMKKDYTRAVKDVAELHKNIGGIKSKDVKEITGRLRAEQALNEKNIIAGKPFVEDAFQEYLALFTGDPKSLATERGKPKYDPNNQEHRVAYEKAKQQANGDTNEINRILGEMFS